MPSKLPTGVSLRGSVYQLRVVIPDDIRHLFPQQAHGKPATDAFRASLKTSDPNEASARAHAIIAEWKRRFEDMRTSTRPAPFTPITDELIAFICDREARAILAFDDGIRFNPDELGQVMRHISPTQPGWLTGKPVRNTTWDAIGSYLGDAQHDSLSALHRSIVFGVRTDLSRGRLDTAQQAALAACAALGVVVDWGQPSARVGLGRIMRAIVKAWEAVEARDAGQSVETPPAPKPPGDATGNQAAPETPVKLADVLPEWITRTKPPAKTTSACKRALALWALATSDPKLKDISKATGAKFVSFLLDPKQKFGNKTAHNHASYINALLNLAVKLDLIERNPVDLTFDKTEGAQRREPWSDKELATMFSNCLFTDKMDEVPHWRGVSPAEGRAMLLLTLHTGARIGEIAQLRAQDIQQRGGLTVIRITAEAGTVKTAESERTVPLPDHLLQNQWFAVWLQSTAKLSGPLFPAMHGTISGPSDVAVKWLRAFRAYAGLPSGGLNGAHRFRHTLRTWLAEVGVNTETADAVTGHAATGSSGRRVYTANVTVPAMKTALDRIPWPKA
ncbi:tyrosine-type recombinase/integrase [Paraburkholderia sp.]|uniref:tyrosine-type recombinase/integrase n=1 Tax=Paraburkholderia sp. TaxID=1926495 RepID=UPI00238AAF37|nr:tyrosine-type recombinase/integrase [Paraburkholderia sp.]MDE1183585.1 tyrosine-type recombinase/integrase [Paraburkholderia sp.]